jgi:hypothetical protein
VDKFGTVFPRRAKFRPIWSHWAQIILGSFQLNTVKHNLKKKSKKFIFKTGKCNNYAFSVISDFKIQEHKKALIGTYVCILGSRFRQSGKVMKINENQKIPGLHAVVAGNWDRCYDLKNIFVK